MGKDQTKTEERENRKKLRQKTSDSSKAKSWAREWFDALVFAGIAALLIRQFFFGAFRIPTPSMEKSLLVGDFLIVSKLHYGPRTPMAIAFPFTSVHIPNLELPWFRIPGFTDIKRYESVVFNYPLEDVVISQKQFYIKRLIGLPGDTLSMQNKQVFINSDSATNLPEMQYLHRVRVAERLRLSDSKVKDAGGQIRSMIAANTYVINMTPSVAQVISQWNGIEEVALFNYPIEYVEPGRSQFVFASGFKGNRDNFDSFVVPYKGQTITLTEDNWTYYYDIIQRYEENDFRRTGDRFIINGESTNRYTIQKNYYFMMGDNRDDSADSRYWGFVPDDHIEGKAFLVYFSWDKERFIPRISRIFSLIH